MAIRTLSTIFSKEQAQESVGAVYSSFKAEKREYQERIVSQCLESYSDKTHSVLIESPTGSGKTVMALSTAQAIYNATEKGSTDDQAEVFAIFVTMRRENLEQAKLSYERFGFDFPIVYASQFEKEFPRATLMIVDEAHHDATSSMQKAYSAIKPAFVLGMTATPYRSDKVGLGFEKIIKDAGYYSLIRDGYLSKPDLYMLNEYNPKSVAKAYIKDHVKWGKTIIFFHTKEQCIEAASLIENSGLACKMLFSESPDREEIIENFRSGEVSCLLNMTLLTEGFDQDDLETVFVRPSVKGLTMQMCGRVLRIPRIKVKKNIVQCSNSKHPFSSYAPVDCRFIELLSEEETEWLGVGSSPLIELVHKRVLEMRLNDKVSQETNLLIENIKQGQTYSNESFRPKLKSAMGGRKSRKRAA